MYETTDSPGTGDISKDHWMRLNVFALLALSSTFTTPLIAQEPPQSAPPIDLVMLNGDGRMVLPSNPLYPPTAYRLEDNNARTTIVFENHTDDITLEVSVFPIDKGSPEGCRAATIPALLADLRTRATIADIKNSTRRSSHGNTLALATFTLSSIGGVNPGSQQHFYAFTAGPHTCAQMHLAKSGYTPDFAPLINAQLDAFHFDAAYQPTAQDYAAIADLFYETKADYREAALFYQRALDVLPNTADTRDLRRNLTDQLSVSYAVYGDFLASYHVNEDAIMGDPAYPYYYYNLACVDAEMHNPLDAKRHLEAAFLRRFNTLPGEQLPNPSLDSSIQKLRSDHKFWSYVKKVSGVSE
jgi:hypothetical protein